MHVCVTVFVTLLLCYVILKELRIIHIYQKVNPPKLGNEIGHPCEIIFLFSILVCTEYSDNVRETVTNILAFFLFL